MFRGGGGEGDAAPVSGVNRVLRQPAVLSMSDKSLFYATPDGVFHLGESRVRAAIGKAGVISAIKKCEGDGASPLGLYPVRRVYYRDDRVERPITRLPCRALRQDDGWCDDPSDPAYNRPVRLPYKASAETLWREDSLYDMILVLGHNDDPPVAPRGSAIFLHCKRGDYEPTQGCIALSPKDVRTLLARLKSGDLVGFTSGDQV